MSDRNGNVFQTFLFTSFPSFLIFVIMRDQCTSISKADGENIWFTKIGSIGILNHFFFQFHFILNIVVPPHIGRTNCEFFEKYVKRIRTREANAVTFFFLFVIRSALNGAFFTLNLVAGLCAHSCCSSYCWWRHSAHFVSLTQTTATATTSIEQIEPNYASASRFIDRVQVDMNLSRSSCSTKMLVCDARSNTMMKGSIACRADVGDAVDRWLGESKNIPFTRTSHTRTAHT